MALGKKRFGMLTAITAALLLGACGDENKSEQTVDESNYDNPRNHDAEDFMALSEGLEKYPVWVETSDNPERNSSVRAVYVFEDGVVTSYDNILNEDTLKLEEINDLTDDEIIQYAKDNSESKTEGEYMLDITIDSLGQYTENMEIVITSGTNVSTDDLENVVGNIYGSMGWEEYGLGDKYPNADTDAYISALKNGEDELPNTNEERTIEINGDEVIYTTQIKDTGLLTFDPQTIHQTIFDTTFSGLRVGDSYSLLTRVDDSFVGFKVDDPDTKSENVTIEGK